jgi:hypothetical protein
VSMFENMVICVEILLSLDISVKYSQCVKIWLFLKCEQFSEALCSIFGEAKGTRAYRTHVSHLSKWRHAYRTRISHLSKGRRVLWRRVSLSLNMCKKSQQNIPHRTPLGLHARHTCSVQSGRGRVEHKIVSIFTVL